MLALLRRLTALRRGFLERCLRRQRVQSRLLDQHIEGGETLEGRQGRLGSRSYMFAAGVRRWPKSNYHQQCRTEALGMEELV